MLPPTYTLREATPDHAAALAALISKVIETSYAADYSDAGRAHFQSFYNAEAVAARTERGTVLLISHGDGVVATGALDGNRIFGLFVDPSQQGVGLGRALMQALEAHARAKGLCRVVLYVSAPGYAFYQRLGYNIGPEIVQDVPGGTIHFWDASKELP